MLQFVHDFCGSVKVNEKSKEVFSNLVTFSKKLELDLQEDIASGLSLYDTMSLLMKT